MFQYIKCLNMVEQQNSLTPLGNKDQPPIKLAQVTLDSYSMGTQSESQMGHPLSYLRILIASSLHPNRDMLG
jgi:hypothetical protein